ncbi:putative stress up-regulated Nod 19 [Tanacetum coccineum]
MTVNRLVLEWEEKIKLHLEREMQFNQWRSKNFKSIHPTPIAAKEEVDDEGEVTDHVPYRDTKPTRILQPALGGNANTAIICNITLAQLNGRTTSVKVYQVIWIVANPTMKWNTCWRELEGRAIKMFSLMGLKGNEDARKILSDDASFLNCDQVLSKRHRVPKNNPFTKIAGVILAALNKCKVPVPSDLKQLLELDFSSASKHSNRWISTNLLVEIFNISEASKRNEMLNFGIINLPALTCSRAWDCSAWVRTYGLLLKERLECYKGLKYDIESERIPKPTQGDDKFDSEFPRGHIAIKSSNAEVVDEAGESVSFQETYLHYWVEVRYYLRKGTKDVKYNSDLGFHQSDFIIAQMVGVQIQPILTIAIPRVQISLKSHSYKLDHISLLKE